MNTFHALGAGNVKCTLGNAFIYVNSWSWETTGDAAADVLDSMTATVAAGATGVYTHTFRSDTKPANIYQCVVTSSIIDRNFTWSYVASTGVLTITAYAVDGDGAWAAAETDEEVFYLTALCTK